MYGYIFSTKQKFKSMYSTYMYVHIAEYWQRNKFKFYKTILFLAYFLILHQVFIFANQKRIICVSANLGLKWTEA